MRLKAGVKYKSVDQAMSDATLIADRVMEKEGYELIKTSVNDSQHSLHSLHYSDAAFDFRSKHLPTLEEKKRILLLVKEALTADFDVLLEHAGADQEHFHLEYDPK